MASAPNQQAPPVTAAQLIDLPDDGLRHELVEGTLRTMTPAGGEHGRIGARLLIRVGVFVEAQQLGEVFTAETGFWLARDPDTVRAPDVAFVRADRVPDARVPGFVPLAPDLVAEVVSPTDRAVEVAGKALSWLDAGVRLVWVVDPENRTVTVHRPDGASVLRAQDVLHGEDVLPGFALPLRELWT
ncbi:Uma2 family endonuclease [Geodermatophilus sp. YIM 151500]|uniref:Uma2 family endonuclease n=1 Tax=Geodermatophilus sp. YIM 151500 TaxID=2984531 RepID=UPI0021E3CBF7|nr:Uma2 family endonuclease [Geodermatophilus sp. YIM 151500]MCV2488238.1 Uma2 family endonuclease [Geodermatophilus sp. YIM 151500]